MPVVGQVLQDDEPLGQLVIGIAQQDQQLEVGQMHFDGLELEPAADVLGRALVQHEELCRGLQAEAFNALIPVLQSIFERLVEAPKRKEVRFEAKHLGVLQEARSWASIDDEPGFELAKFEIQEVGQTRNVALIEVEADLPGRMTARCRTSSALTLAICRPLSKTARDGVTPPASGIR